MHLTEYSLEHIMAVEVIYVDEFGDWFETLDLAAAEAVVVKVRMLEAEGVSLRFPHCSEIKGSRFALRELRIRSGGRPIRVFYAFDPSRDAVLLIGGDKTGDGRFYERLVRRADNIWEQYLTENFGSGR
jgi:hypothetical protein